MSLDANVTYREGNLVSVLVNPQGVIESGVDVDRAVEEFKKLVDAKSYDCATTFYNGQPPYAKRAIFTRAPREVRVLRCSKL